MASEGELAEVHREEKQEVIPRVRVVTAPSSGIMTNCITKVICFDYPRLLSHESISNKPAFLNVKFRVYEIKSQNKFLETNKEKSLIEFGLDHFV